jgi:N-methylhydantoinase A
MARAIKVISVERGYDPRDFALLAFGGAGGLHACDLADMLSIPNIILPKYPGLLSALGVLLSDVVKDYSQTVMLKQGDIDVEKLEQHFARLEKRGLDDLMAEGFQRSRITFSRHLDVRYVGQSFELSVSFSADFIAEFHRAHERRYGYADPTRPVELVTVRVKCRGVTKKPQLTPTEYGGEKAKPAAAEKPVYFNKQAHATRFYRREKLGPGNMIAGPAVILEYSATTVIPPDWQAVVDQFENLIISRKNL